LIFSSYSTPFEKNYAFFLTVKFNNFIIVPKVADTAIVQFVFLNKNMRLPLYMLPAQQEI